MALRPRLFRVRTGVRVAPWGDAVGDVAVLGVRLRDRQEAVVARLGMAFEGEVSPEEAVGEGVYWDDDVDVSFGALRAWLKVAESGSEMALIERPQRLGEIEVERQVPISECVTTGSRDLRAGEFARVVGVRWGRGAKPTLVPTMGWEGKTNLAGPFAGAVPWYLTARTAVTVRHWLHLLRANISAAGISIFEEIGLSPWNVVWNWLRAPMRGGVAAVGRNCEIHPTARLEGCVVGNNVNVGAYSVLRGCWIGDGASIEDHVTARGSVIGPRSHLANYSMFNLSVLGERSSAGHIGAQASVIGNDAFLSTFATLMDLNLRGNAKVEFDGKILDTGIPFCGCAVGHNVRLGANVTIAPGRAVPNGVRVMAEDNVLARLTGTEVAGEYRVRGGRLVPV